MALLITQAQRKGINSEEISQGDLKTMRTALEWKRHGDWTRIKNYVYRHGLHKCRHGLHK